MGVPRVASLPEASCRYTIYGMPLASEVAIPGLNGGVADDVAMSSSYQIRFASSRRPALSGNTVVVRHEVDECSMRFGDGTQA